ncbi:dienelactone hydrolase [Paraphysoderma sedebokerense]|nr:dienelactone hydrolase [Paraphysoderma sedebokerense]
MAQFDIKIPVHHTDRGPIFLPGELFMPSDPNKGIVVFVHGSGSSRFSSRNQYVARRLRQEGVGTLLYDLLTPDEEDIDNITRHLRFDIGFWNSVELLSKRVVATIDYLHNDPKTTNMPLGLFGASTGAAAALMGAFARPDHVNLVISRGGRPDLVPQAVFDNVRCPVLLIVGGRDDVVIDLNRGVERMLKTEIKKMEIVPGATHLFEEPGRLEKVADLAGQWSKTYLVKSKPQAEGGMRAREE